MSVITAQGCKYNKVCLVTASFSYCFQSVVDLLFREHRLVLALSPSITERLKKGSYYLMLTGNVKEKLFPLALTESCSLNITTICFPDANTN